MLEVCELAVTRYLANMGHRFKKQFNDSAKRSLPASYLKYLLSSIKLYREILEKPMLSLIMNFKADLQLCAFYVPCSNENFGSINHNVTTGVA